MTNREKYRAFRRLIAPVLGGHEFFGVSTHLDAMVRLLLDVPASVPALKTRESSKVGHHPLKVGGVGSSPASRAKYRAGWLRAEVRRVDQLGRETIKGFNAMPASLRAKRLMAFRRAVFGFRQGRR